MVCIIVFLLKFFAYFRMTLWTLFKLLCQSCGTMQSLTNSGSDSQRISNGSVVRVRPLIRVVVACELELRVHLLLGHPWVVIIMEALIMTWVHIWNALLLEYHVMGLVDLALSSIFITSSSLSLLLKIIVLSLLIRGLDKNLLLVIFCIAKATYNNIELLLVTVRVDIVWLLNILNVIGWGLMIWLEGPICISARSCRSVCSIIILKWLLLLQLTGSACGWHQDWRILERVN